MKTTEIIERFGVRLLICNNEYLLRFDDPSISRQISDLASRKQEIIDELLRQGVEPSELQTTGVLNQLRLRVFKQRYSAILQKGSVSHVRRVIAVSPAAHALGQQIASNEGMTLYRIIKVFDKN